MIIRHFICPEIEEKVREQVASYEQIKELISVDTLKTMQLLGFNYKAAIGEPLTLMLKNFILYKNSIGNRGYCSAIFGRSISDEMKLNYADDMGVWLFCLIAMQL